MQGPLAGQRIVVTRPGDAGLELAVMLEGLGADVRHIPAIEIDFTPPLEDMKAMLVGTDRVLFSSRHGIEALQPWAEGLRRVEVLAVGEKTARRARDAGWNVILESHRGGLQDLVKEARFLDWTGRVLVWPTGSLSDRNALEELKELGAELRIWMAYETRNPLGASHIDLTGTTALVFASPSALHHLEGALDERQLKTLRGGAQALSIGRTTAAALRDHGWCHVHVAARPSNEGLLALALEFLSGSRPS